MKRKLLVLLSVVASLSLSGCSFFDVLISSNSTTPEPWTGEKQKLTYTEKNLRGATYYDVDYMPSTGKSKLLVLPISFNDTRDFLSNIEKDELLVDLNAAMFGDKATTGWHSVSSYYEEESYGALTIEGEVADWYDSGYYYDSVNDKNTSTVVQNAINHWKSNNPDKVKDFDSDGNGYIDGVFAIYGGPNYKNTDALKRHRANSNMWAYTSWLETTANKENPNGNSFIWASYDFMTGDNSNGVLVDAHTYIHEMGHVLGLDDYYDYADVNDVWAGGFSMQDYNVGGHDPYSSMVLGWVDPYVPTTSTTITIKPFVSSGDVILLSPDFSSNSAFDEYILIEYYSPTGVNEHDSKYQYKHEYPLGPDKNGIRIWHVDSRLLKITETSKRGQTIKQYSIVNTINPDDGSYVVGCTNTTYIQGADTNAYCTAASELRNLKLLELIRRGDYSASRTSDYINNNYLFKSGDTFSLTQYSGYFKSSTKLNNGSKFGWSVKINSITDEEATITVSL